MEEWYTELDKRFFVFIVYKLVKDKPSKERLQWESPRRLNFLVYLAVNEYTNIADKV
jgi:hypothetical protein